LDRRLGGHQNRSGQLEEEKNLVRKGNISDSAPVTISSILKIKNAGFKKPFYIRIFYENDET
jgi:hypothetical protein